MDRPKPWGEPDAGVARELLRHVTKTRSMTAMEQERTTARVARLGAAGAVVGGLAWVQGVAWGAGLGVVAVVAANVVPGLLSPPATLAARPAPPQLTTAARAPSPLPAPAASSAPARPPVVPHEARPAPAAEPADAAPREADSLAEEAALLDPAQAALASSPADAIALASAHAVRFPRGKLMMERELVMVEALRRQGRAAEARARAEVLLPRAAGSLYEARLRKIVDETR
jgi:hypothetical protein